MNKKNLFTNSLLLVSFSLFSLFLIEILFRFYLFGWDSFSIEKINSVHLIGVSGFVQPSPYSEVIYELKPNIKSYFKMATFETNSQGLRDKEYPILRAKNTIRVAVIGDSFTMPAGVNIEDAYHSLLEEKFNQEQRGISYEFVNFGVGGYNLRQYLGVLKYKALKYEPQLIIIGFCFENDYKVPDEERFQKPYKPKDRTYPFFQSFVRQQLNFHVQHQLISRTKKNRREMFSKEQEQYMKGIFSEIATISKEKNIPVVVVYLSYQSATPINQWVERIVLAQGLHFVDVSSSFPEDIKTSDYKIYAIDNHPNDKANKIFADAIYKYLKRNVDRRSWHF
jgi:lysophospholipase L1-like esterase